MKNKEYLTDMNKAMASVSKTPAKQPINEVEIENKKEHIALNNAVAHLRQAIDELKKADKAVKTDDYKHYLQELNDALSSDGGEAGLWPMLKRMVGSKK
jgi:predicted RNA-binding Zn ribbon-like protein